MDWMHAADAHGILSIADLRGAGVSTREVPRMCRSGDLTALLRGWFAVGPVPDDDERHILAVRAALRSHGGRAVAGHHSGLLLMRIPTFRADLGVVRLVRRHSGPTRTSKGVRLGRAVAVEQQLAETVTPALAVLQHGISAGPVSALVAADGALHAGAVTADELSAALDTVHGHPGTAALAELLPHADGRHESPGETRLAHALRLLGVSATPQVRLAAGGFVAVVDFLLDGAPVVLEFDGRVKYSRGADERDPFGRLRPGEQVLWEEKRREDRLRELGYVVVRVTWGDLDHPRELAERIRRAVAQARNRSA